MAKTKEEKAAAVVAWKKANPDKVKAHSKKYYDKNVEREIERARQYRKKTADFELPTGTTPAFKVPVYHFGVSS